jgi:hypothetical protein
MATTSPTPSTPTGQKATAEKKPFSVFLGVDVANAGFGFNDDLAAAAAMRKAMQGQQKK